jgi:chromate transporter
LTSLRALFGVFFRIGNATFGGGDAITAALRRELVERRKWLDPSQFALCYALSRVTPGTNQFAFSTAAGWTLRGWAGALLALIAVSAPSCAMITFIAAGFGTWSGVGWVQVAILGALAASVGVLLAGFWLLIAPYLDHGNWLRSSVIVAGSIGLSLGFSVAPVRVLGLAAVIGLLWKERQS